MNHRSVDSARTTLVDAIGRRMRKLRVSLLDTCNFRCSYCMPGKPRFTRQDNLLAADEIRSIVDVLCHMGIEEVRLTGGEPTLRHDLVAIAASLSELPLSRIALTSNGLLLGRYLDDLRRTRCTHLNISLDSLDPKTFAQLARIDGYDAVVGAILRARDLGFDVKINMVVMRGINDHEIPAFVGFAVRHDIEVRFLELMAIGQAAGMQRDRLVTAAEIREIVGRHSALIPRHREADATAVPYTTESGARVGIIAPVTESFCGSCSRWRLGCDGTLRACLMSTEGLSLRGQSAERIRELAMVALGMKPLAGAPETPLMMHGLGG